MPLITTGKQFIRDLENAGTLALYAPLEGGAEGRYQRRLRAAGYGMLHISARGMGDPAAYLMDVHGIRPPHLGKKDTGREGAVGARYFVPPIAGYQLEKLPPQSKGLAIWIIEGFVFSRQELEYLAVLSSIEPRLKVCVEMGGDRTFRWSPLKQVLAAA
ncbi:MAG: NAD(P)H-quinone oxidoreductase subunit N [Leptolyngbyaceae cyanobacterium SM1_3_5]|nr:NAD(P)H-quinone oxidoreductase subunit N [Leptolyngbyaceae cyanobacterium SM1_3_5]